MQNKSHSHDRKGKETQIGGLGGEQEDREEQEEEERKGKVQFKPTEMVDGDARMIAVWMLLKHYTSVAGSTLRHQQQNSE
jgi:hypothetical protein